MHNHVFANHVAPMKGRAILVLVLAIGLILAALGALPILLNMAMVKQALLHEVEQQIGHRITARRLDIGLVPRPRLDLRQVQIDDPSSKEPLFTAERVEMAFQIWPLFEGRVVSAYAVVERPQVTIRHSETGQWTIGTRIQDASSATSTPVMPLTFVRKVLVADGLLTIVDESRRAPGSIQVASLQATMTEEIPGRTARIQVSGEIPQDMESAVFNLDGLLVQGHVDSATEPPGFPIPVQVEATIRVHRLNLRQMALWAGLGSVSDGLLGPGQLTAHMRLVPRPTGYDLILSEWKAGLLDISVQGTSSLTGLGTEAPNLSVTVSAQPVTLKQVLNQVPSTWMSAQIRAMLMDQAVDGLITVHECLIAGMIKDNLQLNVRGEVEVREGRFLPGRDQPVVRDLAARISYDLERIQVVALRANYGPVRFSEGTILVNNWRKDPMADARISGEVPASGLVALLNDGVISLQAEKALSQLEQVTGEIQMGAHLTGWPTKGGGISLVDAVLTMRNVGFRHLVLPVPFRSIQGRLNISSTEIRVVGLDGQVGPALAEVGGRIMLAGKPAFQEMTLKVRAEGKNIAPWLDQVGSDRFRPKVEGPIVLNAAVTGHIGTPRFKGVFILDGASVEIPHVFTKTRGPPAGIRFDGELNENRVLILRRGEMVFPPVRLTGNGRIGLADGGHFRAKIISDALSLESLTQGVTLGSVRAGILKGVLKIEGTAADRGSWMTSGRLRFDKGVIEVESLPDPIRELTVGLQFDGKNIDIRRLKFNIGDSDVRVSGSITDWLDVPQAKLVVESSQIDVRSVWPIKKVSSPADEALPILRSWWSQGMVTATVLVDHVYYERFLLTGLSCRIRFEEGSLTIDRISGDTNDGHLGGRVAMTMPERGPGSIRTSFRASGIPVERLVSLVEDRRRVSGWMTATGRVQAEFVGSRLLLSSINSGRPISVIIEDGRMFNAPVISKLLSVMNLPALLEGKVDFAKEGMPLDRVKVVFSVNDGLIRIKEFLLDSPILKISGTGRYDFIGDQWDLLLVTSPLGQYSDLLKRIPLFGKLFAGERQGFDTAIFEVKGSAKDPNVVYLPAESLMAGVKGTAQLAIDLLVNAITLPKEAFTIAEEALGDEEELRGGGKDSEF